VITWGKNRKIKEQRRANPLRLPYKEKHSKLDKIEII